MDFVGGRWDRRSGRRDTTADSGARVKLDSMESPKVDMPRESGGSGWSALRLLPSPVWATLLVGLVVLLAIAAIADRPVRLVAMAVIGVVLLAFVARLIASEAARQQRLRAAAEHQAAEAERIVQTRTRELSDLSTHLQEFAEKEKS